MNKIPAFFAACIMAFGACLAAPATPDVSNRPAVSTSLRLEFARYLGGTGEDRAHGLAVDPAGNIYLTAPIDSKDFPTTPDALSRTPSGLYFAQLGPTGTLLYSTYLGAAGGINYVHGVALDRDGCIYLAGNTTNPSFLTTPGAFQTTFRGPGDGHHGDAFVIKLSPAGDRVIYATLLGGTSRDMAGKIAVDDAGHAYVLGSTSSPDFPVTAGAFQTAFKGGEATPAARGDVFVAKLSPDGRELVYCTLVGGNGIDQHGGNLLLDVTGSVAFAVTTTSTDFPTSANAFAPSFRGGAGERGGGDAVVVKLNPTGTALEYASYLGGSGVEYGNHVALDSAGNLWLTGETSSDDFPTTEHAYSRTPRGGSDVFFARLDPRSGALLYASLLGGSKPDRNPALAVDSAGRLVLVGRTESADFPTTADAPFRILQGPTDLFVALFDPATNSLRSSTLLGGSGHEVPGPVVIANGAVYLAGNTTSVDFPVTPGAGDTTYQGGKSEWGGDAFVARFALPAIHRSVDSASMPTRAVLSAPATDAMAKRADSFVCDYLGESPPSDEPVVFGRGTVSVEDKNTHAVQFSPDGRRLIFSRYPDRTSYEMRRGTEGWSQPAPTRFTGKEVSFDATKHRLFYYDRGGDLFWVRYDDAGFSEPTPLGPTINTRETEYYPSITARGNLYFSRNARWDQGRLMVAAPAGDGFNVPVDLGERVNAGGASHGFVAPDTVSPDGKYLFFTRLPLERGGAGFVYWVATASIPLLCDLTASSSK
ncbi:SBBP repeat-containing protein [Opitutus terrae]|uniref:Uncharacterized protein n=1 Tax=Opitutus terrae (strain DSM 11246 / JCM 15787 / PB90-1) TaxID=452637 RepID=B1ZWZ5_OPITP|nr:SBBP repeat-containing protein [Opitutus terrae]ACB75106.1 hypothetical protein Oter_1823 [Opitutus terrae PB90-1]